jgi:capsular exopolysaccharide synthesis family protein
MGKFDDALKKARAATGGNPGNPASRKVVQIPREDIHSMRLDAKAPETKSVMPQPFRDRVDPHLVCLNEPSSPAAECFKLLRSKLMVGDSGELRRAIMVTGTQPQDGKSLVSANLAVSIAQGIDTDVVLIDCDMRRPSLHKTFGLRLGDGLREYLEEGKSIDPYLYQTPVPKLTLIPAGKSLSSPSELLSSEKMMLLIEGLRGHHKDRFIILDSPPAHFTADAAVLFSTLDGVLLVVRSGKTPRKPLEDVVEHIGREKIIGVVFNSSTEVQSDYRYYYRYYQRGEKP